ncbi:rRNA adenine N-6-methyltransferase family protein [Nocardia gipuzkoensis]
MTTSQVDPRRELGQHFLHSLPTAEKLVDHVGRWEPTQILEIGAGLGTLSRAILRRGYRLWAVEKDERMASPLAECQRNYGSSMRVTIDDIRNVAVQNELGTDCALLSILPFDHQLSSDIIRDVFERAPLLSRGVVVVPDTVAECVTEQVDVTCLRLDTIDRYDFTPSAPMSLSIYAITRGAE